MHDTVGEKRLLRIILFLVIIHTFLIICRVADTESMVKGQILFHKRETKWKQKEELKMLLCMISRLHPHKRGGGDVQIFLNWKETCQIADGSSNRLHSSIIQVRKWKWKRIYNVIETKKFLPELSQNPRSKKVSSSYSSAFIEPRKSRLSDVHNVGKELWPALLKYSFET